MHIQKRAWNYMRKYRLQRDG